MAEWSITVLLVATALSLYQTNPIGRETYGLDAALDWKVTPPPATVATNDLWIMSLAVASGNRGRPDRHWIGIVGQWYRVGALDSLIVKTRQALADLRRKTSRLSPVECIAALHVCTFVVASPTLWESPGGLVGNSVLVKHFAVTSSSMWRPWTFITSQMVILDVISLLIHVSMLLSLGQAAGVQFGAQKMNRVYFATGAGFAITQWAADQLFARHGARNIGPTGNLIGLTAAIVGANQQAWSFSGTTTMYMLGIELAGPGQLLAVLVVLHVGQRGITSIPGCAGAAVIGHYLGTYYGAQWHHGVMAKLDGWLDVGYSHIFDYLP